MSGEIDVESGKRSHSPNPTKMYENPELKWSFTRKVYSITTFQLLLTIVVLSTVLFVSPVANFFNSIQGTVVYIVLIFVSHITLFPLLYYPQKYPLNYFLLILFNVSSAFSIELTCNFIDGKVILDVLISTTAMMFVFTLYTYWAAKKGHDFSILGSFLFVSWSILILFSFTQLLFDPLGIPLQKLSHIFGCVVSIMFCGYIVDDTTSLIKIVNYDEHIQAFVLLYLDIIIGLFIPLVIICI